jgi:hypothetical protein
MIASLKRNYQLLIPIGIAVLVLPFIIGVHAFSIGIVEPSRSVWLAKLLFPYTILIAFSNSQGQSPHFIYFFYPIVQTLTYGTVVGIAWRNGKFPAGLLLFHAMGSGLAFLLHLSDHL